MKSETSSREPSSRMTPGRSLPGSPNRSEEHTSELQSQSNLVCRLLLEKKTSQPARRSDLSRDHEFTDILKPITFCHSEWASAPRNLLFKFRRELSFSSSEALSKPTNLFELDYEQ